MDRFAHSSLALLAYLTVVRALNLQPPSLFLEADRGLWSLIDSFNIFLTTYAITFLLCLAGSRLPDWIDRDRGPGHRGLGHSLFSLFLLGALTYFVFLRVSPALAPLYMVAFMAGYLSHLLLDFITYEGVPWFWPDDRKLSLNLGSAGGLVVGLIGVLSLLLSIWLFIEWVLPGTEVLS